MNALVTFVLPEWASDPANYLRSVVASDAQYHFTMTSESRDMTIQQQRERIEELEAKVDRYMDDVAKLRQLEAVCIEFIENVQVRPEIKAANRMSEVLDL